MGEASRESEEARMWSHMHALKAEHHELQARLQEIALTEQDNDSERQRRILMAIRQEQREQVMRVMENKISDRVNNFNEQQERARQLMLARDMEQKERTRRLLENSFSDRFSSFQEQQDRARNQAYSLQVQELERARRLVHIQEEQERAKQLSSMMMLSDDMQSREKRSFKDKQKRNLENAAFLHLGKVLGLNSRGQRHNQLTILSKACECITSLRNENMSLLQERARLSHIAHAGFGGNANFHNHPLVASASKKRSYPASEQGSNNGRPGPSKFPCFNPQAVQMHLPTSVPSGLSTNHFSDIPCGIASQTIPTKNSFAILEAVDVVPDPYTGDFNKAQKQQMDVETQDITEDFLL